MGQFCIGWDRSEGVQDGRRGMTSSYLRFHTHTHTHTVHSRQFSPPRICIEYYIKSMNDKCQNKTLYTLKPPPKHLLNAHAHNPNRGISFIHSFCTRIPSLGWKPLIVCIHAYTHAYTHPYIRTLPTTPIPLLALQHSSSNPQCSSYQDSSY